jgi:lipopolysaccharide export system protein LptC
LAFRPRDSVACTPSPRDAATEHEGGALASASTIGGLNSRSDPDAIARKFRKARRHSLRVRMLRVALPVAIVLIIGGTIAVSYFNPFRVLLARLPLDPSKIVISGTKITMAAPRLAGFTRDARAYDVSARAASQDLTKPDMLELQDIRAKFDMENKSQVELTAVDGLYNRKTEQLTLLNKILLTTTSGYEARLTQAIVDVKSGTVKSQNPVEVKLLNGTLNASRLEVDDKGEMIRFEGGVSMVLILDGDKQQAAQR